MFGELRIRVDDSSVTVSGEVDRTTADSLREELSAAALRHATVTVDLSRVTYLDSSGIAVLFDRLRHGGLHLVADGDCLVRPVIEVAGLPVEPPA